jgi:5'-deoxynucleotidase YfbR-like HD superfamily hydrolase
VTAATAVTAGPEPVVTPGLAGLLGELSDLKRVRVAGRDGSLAEQGFARSWAALAAGDAPADVALRETARALAAVPLGGIDGALLAEAGVGDAGDVLRGAVDLAAGDRVDPALRAALRSAVTGTDPEGAGPPAFVAALAAQPRAGATAPGRPRLVLEPPESHADHCFAVAVGAVLLAPGCGATPARASSARSRTTCTTRACPMRGSRVRRCSATGTTGSWSTSPDAALASSRRRCATACRAALGLNLHVDTPEARAVVAADVLDRVVQMRQYARTAAFTLDVALDELDLVHAGPLQAYGLAVVDRAGLR